MLSKKELKYYSSLLKKKYRNQESKFLVEGKKLVAEGLNSNYNCEIIIAANSFKENESEYLLEIAAPGIRFETVKNSDFVKLGDTVNPQGIAAVFRKPYTSEKINSRLVVYLEDISDPGNLGTLIRSCDWFGIEEVLLSPHCAEIYNPKVIRSSMGSIFHLRLIELKDLLPLNSLKLNGYKIICSDLEGENIFKFNFPEKCIIVFANEANGPSGFITGMTDKFVTIPKYGKAESLNVANAASIILAQAANQFH